MGAFRDLTGQTFNRLTAVRPVGKTKVGQYIWEFKCECGSGIEVIGNRVVRGNTKSCGCLNREKRVLTGRRNTAHGHRSGYKTSRTYRSWRSMMGRCTNPEYQGFKYWGGRGIGVCGRWYEFECFLADMGERPEGMTLDRIDPEGHYEPGNCRWATPLQQRHNRRSLDPIRRDSSAKSWAVWYLGA